jgi:hypothetical protein
MSILFIISKTKNSVEIQISNKNYTSNFGFKFVT